MSAAAPRIVVTAAEVTAAALVEALRVAGAEALAVPLIETHGLDVPGLVDALARATDVVITSAAVVRHHGDVLRGAGQATFHAVGTQTQAALAEIGVAALIPAEHTGRGLGRELAARVASDRMFLLLRAAAGGNDVEDELAAAGAVVEALAVYETVVVPGVTASLRTALAGAAAVTLSSASAARALVDALGGVAELDGVAIACIGPTTVAAAAEVGLIVAVVAPQPDAASLAEAVLGHLARQRHAVRG